MIDILARWRFRRRVIAAVRELPELPRLVFIDSARHGLSYEQIAVKRGLRQQDVEALLRLALIDLQDALYPGEAD